MVNITDLIRCHSNQTNKYKKMLNLFLISVFDMFHYMKYMMFYRMKYMFGTNNYMLYTLFADHHHSIRYRIDTNPMNYLMVRIFVNITCRKYNNLYLLHPSRYYMYIGRVNILDLNLIRSNL